MICYLYEAPKYFFFASDLPQLLYYSHFPAIVISLVVGFFVLLNGPKKLTNRLLFLITVLFSLWVLLSLISWTNTSASLISFIWPFFGVIKTILTILCVYFIYTFLNKGEDVSSAVKTVFLLLLAPVLIFAPTDLSIKGFDLVNCDAFAYEVMYFKYYYTTISYIAIFWIFTLLIKAYKKADGDFKKQIILMGTGMELFLFMFVTFIFIVTYYTNIGVLADSRLEMYGLFGQVAFMVILSILIVKFKTFQTSLISAKALVIALLLLIASQLTFADNASSVVLTILTLLLTTVTGLFLIKSVEKEIKQKSELQKITTQLELANRRLKEVDQLKSEFVSIASHQLRSPLTAIRGYASMVLEESYGKIPDKARIAIKRIEDSSKLMALGIEDYLNVSRIESGNMKYVLSDFNLKNETEKICDDLRTEAMEQGLVLIFRTDLKSKGIVNADIGKTVQIVQNLIQNSIKYTVKGSIKVLVRDDVVRKKIHVDIEDTGIGMSSETLEKIFQKFERASNANSVNVSGTGLGLYVAIKMAEAMNGDISAHSEGDGKGSRFTFTLNLAM